MEKVLKRTLRGGRFVNVGHVRSKTMAAIHGKNNRTTEIKLMQALRRVGCKGWRRHANHIPGQPDFFFPVASMAIFVDGCFWHGCKQCGHIPKTRRVFWKTKILRNNARHRKVAKLLRHAHVSHLRIWEHTLKTEALANRVAQKILIAINRAATNKQISLSASKNNKNARKQSLIANLNNTLWQLN